MLAWFRPLGLFALGCLAALSWTSCTGAPTPTLPVIDTANGIETPTAPSGTGDLSRQVPAIDPERNGEAANLTGKWFGSLDTFDPAEPTANSWNIDLDLTQRGKRVDGVVIISELIPIAVNIWDVHIRLDATTEGRWNAGEAHLSLFQDLRGDGSGDGTVVNPKLNKDREMEYVEAVITGVVNNQLQGHLVIHWRNPYDYNAGWSQTCQFKDIEPVTQGSGEGPGGG